jgi:WD40 repeat protein
MLIESNADYATAMTVAWSPDETMLATTSFWSGTVYIWDAETSSIITSHQLHGDMAGIIEWSPTGDRVASTSPNGSAYIWDPLTGEIFLSLFPDDFTHWVTGLAWSHDGTKLAISAEDNFGRIFDAVTGEVLVQFCCQEAAAWQITWTPNDDRILTSSADGTVKVWDAATGAEVANYEVGGFTSGAFSPDGTKILIATTDGTLRVYPHWQTTEALIAHARECCLIRELTPEEREQFGLPPLEEAGMEPGSGFEPSRLPFALLASAGMLAATLTFSGLRRAGSHDPARRAGEPIQ